MRLLQSLTSKMYVENSNDKTSLGVMLIVSIFLGRKKVMAIVDSYISSSTCLT